MSRRRSERQRPKGHRLPHRRSHSRRTTCECGKIRYPDHTAAVVALHEAANSRRFAAEHGLTSARREIRSYACKQCRGFHLTSIPVFEEARDAA